MSNPIHQIYEFNQKAGLLDKPYSDFLESSFQVEEALEGFDCLYVLAKYVNLDPTTPKLPREIARKVVSIAQDGVSPDPSNPPKPLPDLDRLDKALDAIVFAFGSIFKLGLTPEQALRALSAVMQANLQKLSMPKDSHGKLTKPADFVGPESQLQLILKERHCDN